MSATARRRLNGSLIVFLFSALGFLWSLPAHAQDVAPVAPSFDLTSIVVSLIIPYVASGLSIASIIGVVKMVAKRLRRVPVLRLVASLFVKDEGATKLRPEQVDATLGLVIALAFASAWSGGIVPLGGESAGWLGRAGAACLVIALAIGSREGLRSALGRRPKARLES